MSWHWRNNYYMINTAEDFTHIYRVVSSFIKSRTEPQ